MNKPLLVAAICGTLFLQSCASILHGSKSELSIKGTPEKAEIYVNGNFMGEAPNTIKVRNTEFKNGNSLVVKSNGQEQTFTLKRRVMAGYLIADIILGGFIFTGIDFLTGAIYKGSPEEINYKMNSDVSANK
ncbi:hypothetical protein Pedsa_0901 [Pseudopedobacter saltans DSM 12145]|uniref:PEGA domain-containing protein n=1 Tax=Pseudopedobacter saltans (strain ATCC 51119 / DSM 12145 / JCM 21818 / CCUG 39354 / LMG 10337 / NBRC 100064 / NCIMB 13643) TaxID=762903 RepID=F0SA96_PSESL|nr:PEGA domain-containing protein [Pseudopedobacter saltans]ADY51473.1 hypothetical protein Pedsa_0901 [Pseudopedobacter saltans DSM 12145]